MIPRDRQNQTLDRFAAALTIAALLWLVPAILHGLWVHR